MSHNMLEAKVYDKVYMSACDCVLGMLERANKYGGLGSITMPAIKLKDNFDGYGIPNMQIVRLRFRGIKLIPALQSTTYGGIVIGGINSTKDLEDLLRKHYHKLIEVRYIVVTEEECLIYNEGCIMNIIEPEVFECPFALCTHQCQIS